MTIDWDEWKYYFLLHPARSIEDIAGFWKRYTVRLFCILLYFYVAINFIAIIVTT